MNIVATQTIPATWSQHLASFFSPTHLKSLLRSALKIAGTLLVYTGHATGNQVTTTGGVVSIGAGMFLSWLDSTPTTQVSTQGIATNSSPAITISSITQSPPPTGSGNAAGSVPVLALLCVLLYLVTGCKSVTTTNVLESTNSAGVVTTNTIVTTNTTLFGITVTPMGVYTTLRGGTASSARIALAADTNSVAYLNAVRQALGDALGSTNYNSATLLAAINAIPNTSVKNPTAVAAINAGFAAFEILEPILAQQVNGHNAFVIPALQGLYDGIGDALGIVAPTPTFSSDLKDAAVISHAALFTKPYTTFWVLDKRGKLSGFLPAALLPPPPTFINVIATSAVIK